MTTMTDDDLDRLEVARALLPLLQPDAGMEWKQLGLCSEVDPDMWFPERGSSVKEAKRICQGCPVRAQCLEYALDNDERFGVWGGMSERERRRLRRARQQADPHGGASFARDDIPRIREFQRTA